MKRSLAQLHKSIIKKQLNAQTLSVDLKKHIEDCHKIILIRKIIYFQTNDKYVLCEYFKFIFKSCKNTHLINSSKKR